MKITHRTSLFSNNTSSIKVCLNLLILEPSPSGAWIPHVLCTFLSRRDSDQPHPKLKTIFLNVCMFVSFLKLNYLGTGVTLYSLYVTPASSMVLGHKTCPQQMTIVSIFCEVINGHAMMKEEGLEVYEELATGWRVIHSAHLNLEHQLSSLRLNIQSSLSLASLIRQLRRYGAPEAEGAWAQHPWKTPKFKKDS